MKELSIGEKAKRYDEAIEKFDVILNLDTVKESGTIFAEDVRKILPELKESEDESIRKSLLAYIKRDSKKLDTTKWIAWLEKQKTSEEALEYLKHNHSPSEVSDFQAAMNIAVKKAFDEGKKQGEQKLTDAKEYDFHGIKFIPKFAKGDIIKDKKRGEVSTIEGFSYDTGLYTHTYGQFPITIQDNYEIIEQKSSWSEEDKSCINQLIVFCENCMVQDSNAKKCANWLKSLRPQSQWKPSLAQLNALGVVAKGNAPDDIEEISSLYKDLKKLKG